MTILKFALLGAVSSGIFGWVVGSGFWLISHTTYDYWTMVGGVTLIVAGVGGAIGAFIGTAPDQF